MENRLIGASGFVGSTILKELLARPFGQRDR